MIPVGWKIVRVAGDGLSYRRHDGLQVITSEAVEEDMRLWRHVSCSRRSRLPSWADLTAVKHLFIGDDLYAYQVFSPRDRHINLHPYCLHLFACLQGESQALPDFTRGGKSI